MLVGEAPGEDEDILGEPFVGRCGRFLDNMLLKAGLDRASLYITNTVKCRPTIGQRNRPPSDSEIQACKPWLWEEIKLIQPKHIITLGKIPTATLLSKELPKTFSLGAAMGKSYEVSYCTAKIWPCYHPSFIMVRAHAKEIDVINLFKLVKGSI